MHLRMDVSYLFKIQNLLKACFLIVFAIFTFPLFALSGLLETTRPQPGDLNPAATRRGGLPGAAILTRGMFTQPIRSFFLPLRTHVRLAIAQPTQVKRQPGLTQQAL